MFEGRFDCNIRLRSAAGLAAAVSGNTLASELRIHYMIAP
jgi:hypothetical protein